MMMIMMMTLSTLSLLDLSYRHILKVKSHTEPVPITGLLHFGDLFTFWPLAKIKV